MSTEALHMKCSYSLNVLIALNWEQPKPPSLSEWINKSRYTHTMEYYLAVIYMQESQEHAE